MSDALIAECVWEAYIRPIRSVLAVDDDFHQYDAAKQGADPDRAKAIWRACRSRGLLCDIDDGSDLINGKAAPHLLNSDLVILDYHLRGTESQWSLELLRRLADSEHASLVVVYTKEKDVLGIRRAVAAHLRGVKARDQWFPNAEISNLWDEVADKHGYVPTEALVDAYIRGDKRPCRSDKELQDKLKAVNVKGQAIPLVTDAIYDTALMKAFGVKPGNLCEKPPQPGGSATAPWVYAHNLFVVCVIKTPENINNGELVFEELKKALCEWNPDFMMSSVAFARGEFARGGFDHERASLNDPHLQAGWLYHAWAGSVQEQGARLRVLFERIVRSYAGRILDKVIEFGRKHIPKRDDPKADLETLKAAIGHFFSADRPSEERVLHVLNEYLAVEDIPGHVETGTIFVREADSIKKGFVYLCVTPACDMVPRPPTGGWQKQMHPMRPMIAMRCRINDVTANNLEIAERSHCIFLTVDNKQKAVILEDDDSPLPVLEWFIVHGMGKINTGIFKAVRFDCAEKDTGGAVTMAMEPMKVLGQIRSIYANRILQLAGQHMSRIGVDFVSLPKPPEAKQEAKPGPAPKASVPPQSKVDPTSGAQATAPAVSKVAQPPAAKPEPAPPTKPDAPPPQRAPE